MERNMDESRKQFEAWLKEIGHRTDKDQFGGYVFSYAASTWVGWQASRAAIEIEMRKPNQGSLPGDYHIGYDSGAESQYESDVEVIRAAGIKVKE